MKKYTQGTRTLHVLTLTREIKKMRTELTEHRYYFERNVARRTESLRLRIALLESCNKALCDKLAQSRAQHAASQEQADVPAPLYLLDRDVLRVA